VKYILTFWLAGWMFSWGFYARLTEEARSPLGAAAVGVAWPILLGSAACNALYPDLPDIPE
jgi:hypothetical protein